MEEEERKKDVADIDDDAWYGFPALVGHVKFFLSLHVF